MPITLLVRITVAKLVPISRRVAAFAAVARSSAFASAASAGAAEDTADESGATARIPSPGTKSARRIVRSSVKQATACATAVAAAAPPTPKPSGLKMSSGSSTKLMTAAIAAARSGARVLPCHRWHGR